MLLNQFTPKIASLLMLLKSVEYNIPQVVNFDPDKLEKRGNVSPYEAAKEIIDNNSVNKPKAAKKRRKTSLENKILRNEYDIFLAHNSKDKEDVLQIAEELKRRNIYPWIDKEQIKPGTFFQEIIQNVLPKVRAGAVIIGKNGIGKWQGMEIKTLINRCLEEKIPVIPILLPGVETIPDGVPFLGELSWIKFNAITDESSYDQLEWGITGVFPEKEKS